MLPDEESFVPSGPLRVMQIIALALPAGLLTFTIVTLVRGPDANPAPKANNLPFVSLMAGGMFLTCAVMSLLIPKMITKASVDKLREKAKSSATPQDSASSAEAFIGQLLGIRQIALIVALALLEGPGFFGCVAYLIEGQSLVVLVPLLSLGLMLAQFPTRGKVATWLRGQLESLSGMLGNFS